MDPRADLQEATERNAREAREEQEAREAEARRAAAAQAALEEEAAKALAEATARAQAEAEAAAAAGEALMVTPLRVIAPGDMEPSPGGASGDQPGLGGSGDDVIILEKAPEPTPPTGRPKAAGLSLRPHSRRRASRPRELRWRSGFRQAGVQGRPRLSRRRLRRSHSRP